MSFNRNDYILTINENGDEVMVHRSNFAMLPTKEPQTVVEHVSVAVFETVVAVAEPRQTVNRHFDTSTEYGRWLSGALELGSLGIVTSHEADKHVDKGTAVRIPEAMKRLGFKTRETLLRVLARGKIKCWFLRELTDFSGAYVSTESIREYAKSEEYSKTISRAATNFMTKNKAVVEPEPKKLEPKLVATTEQPKTITRKAGQPLRLNNLNQLGAFKENFK